MTDPRGPLGAPDGARFGARCAISAQWLGACLLLLVVTGSIHANDQNLTRSLRAEPADEAHASRQDNDRYFEVGVVAALARPAGERPREDRNKLVLALGVSVGFAWRHEWLFVEGRRGGFDGVNLGVTLWQDARNTLELLAVHIPGDFSIDVDNDVENGDSSDADRKLLERTSLILGSGIRWRHYRGDALLQLSTAVDWQNDHGLVTSLHLGRQWQWRNWNAQSIVGLRHVTGSLADVVWGIDTEEATERFPAYEVPSTVFGDVELSLSRPISRRSVWINALRFRRFDSGVIDSPLVAESSTVTVETGVSFVF